MATLQLKTVKVTTDLEKFVAEVVPADIQSTLHYIFLSEMEAQQRMKNVATQTLFDGKRGTLPNAQFRAQAFFSTKTRLLEATLAAYQMLVGLTRIKSGAARASYAVYVNDSPIGGPEQIKQIVDAMDPSDTISIVGPGVVYGRRLFWNPLGHTRTLRKKKAHVSTKKGEKVTIYGTYTEPMHRAVVRVLGRRFRDLMIVHYFVPLRHGSGPHGARFPAVGLFMRGRGSAVH